MVSFLTEEKEEVMIAGMTGEIAEMIEEVVAVETEEITGAAEEWVEAVEEAEVVEEEDKFKLRAASY